MESTRDDPRGILAWLDSAVAVRPELLPAPDAVRRELGRESLTYQVARARLAMLWNHLAAQPEALVKRRLWSDLLEKAYGSSVDSDDFFFQHTYLTIVAKTMALRALGLPLPAPADLLSGQPFQDAGIAGAVESDFFDWAVQDPDLVRRIRLQKVLFELPIPRFEAADPRHRELAAAAEEAERQAAHVPIGSARFVRARQFIRQALQAAGLLPRIDVLVEELLARA